MNNYRVIKQPDYHFKKSNEYFRECEKNNMPFIVIRQKVKFCDVHWDYISIQDFKPDDNFNNRIKAVMSRYCKSKYFIYGAVATLYKLSLEDALKAADEIYQEFKNVNNQEVNKC